MSVSNGPSGWEGKSRSDQTHEGKHGWGGEGWLFDFGKIHTDSYHYITYRPSAGRSTYAGQILDVNLFFQEQQKRKEFVWVGEI
ncbi:MAG: hypothetical protein IPN76_29700 [Saprospiraceae bacterium]|nr:hypothetical protein [Saprospiraceae bacterium]